MARPAHSTRDPDAMHYIMRDDMGEIAAVFARPQHDGEEPIAMEDPELLAFVAGGDSEAALRSYLAGTDAEFLRIVEDLVNVLIDRNLIRRTAKTPQADGDSRQTSELLAYILSNWPGRTQDLVTAE